MDIILKCGQSFQGKIDNTSKMMYYEGVMDIYDYTTSGGKNLIKEYIEKLPNPLKAEIFSVRQLICEKGIEAFALLATRQLYKKLWEIKISQERIMYVIRDQESVYFLNICKKQKNAASRELIDFINGVYKFDPACLTS